VSMASSRNLSVVLSKGRKHFSCYIARGQSVQSYSAVTESFMISISSSTFMVVKCSYVYKVKYP